MEIQKKGNENSAIHKFAQKLSKPGIIKILLAVGATGVALILISEIFWPQGAAKQTVSPAATSSSDSMDSYASKVESRLQNILVRINGVGNVKVMVTVQSGVENVFEQNNKESSDKSQDTTSEGDSQTKDDNNDEHDPAIVQNDGGGQQALLKTQIEPKVQGVVVVCEGGGDPAVCEDVVDTVSTALGIPTNHITVNKMAVSGK